MESGSGRTIRRRRTQSVEELVDEVAGGSGDGLQPEQCFAGGGRPGGSHWCGSCARVLGRICLPRLRPDDPAESGVLWRFPPSPCLVRLNLTVRLTGPRLLRTGRGSGRSRIRSALRRARRPLAGSSWRRHPGRVVGGRIRARDRVAHRRGRVEERIRTADTRGAFEDHRFGSTSSTHGRRQTHPRGALPVAAKTSCFRCRRRHGLA